MFQNVNTITFSWHSFENIFFIRVFVIKKTAIVMIPYIKNKLSTRSHLTQAFPKFAH